MIRLKKLAFNLSAKLSGSTFAKRENVKCIRNTMVYKLKTDASVDESLALNRLTLSAVLIKTNRNN